MESFKDANAWLAFRCDEGLGEISAFALLGPSHPAKAVITWDEALGSPDYALEPIERWRNQRVIRVGQPTRSGCGRRR